MYSKLNCTWEVVRKDYLRDNRLQVQKFIRERVYIKNVAFLRTLLNKKVGDGGVNTLTAVDGAGQWQRRERVMVVAKAAATSMGPSPLVHVTPAGARRPPGLLPLSLGLL
jgi:hypothetical protein